MDRHRKPKQLAKNAKNPGKTRVLPAERTGTEQPANSLGKSKFKNEAAQNPTRAAEHLVRWQRARQRTSKTNVLTNAPIYRVTVSRLQGHL